LPPRAHSRQGLAETRAGEGQVLHSDDFDVCLWDSTVGRDGQSMIIQGWRKPVAMSHPFQLGVAKTIHLSEKTVTSAMGEVAPFPWTV
jgi:hypothetical protein